MCRDCGCDDDYDYFDGYEEEEDSEYRDNLEEDYGWDDMEVWDEEDDDLGLIDLDD